MNNYYWTAESWGSEVPPTNYEEIVNAVNDHLDSIDVEDDYDCAERLIESDRLWELLCIADEVLGIKAEYEAD